MKTITLLIFTMMFNGCGTTKIDTSSLNYNKEDNTNTLKATQLTQDNNMLIEYSAVTRGSYFMISVDSDNIILKNSHAEKPTIKVCSKADWSKVMQYVKDVNLKTLNTIKPPSKAHQHDGARIADLKITKDGKTYQTQSFDDGNPPKEIADLVNTILELVNTEKTKGN